jgi:hypothetical protein
MYSVIFNRVEEDYSYKETVGFFSTKEKAEEVCNFINANLKSLLEVFNNLPEHIKEDLNHYGRYRYLSDEKKSEVNEILKSQSIYIQKYFKESMLDDYYLENSFAETIECIVDNFDVNNFNI